MHHPAAFRRVCVCWNAVLLLIFFGSVFILNFATITAQKNARTLYPFNSRFSPSSSSLIYQFWFLNWNDFVTYWKRVRHLNDSALTFPLHWIIGSNVFFFVAFTKRQSNEKKNWFYEKVNYRYWRAIVCDSINWVLLRAILTETNDRSMNDVRVWRKWHLKRSVFLLLLLLLMMMMFMIRMNAIVNAYIMLATLA